MRVGKREGGGFGRGKIERGVLRGKVRGEEIVKGASFTNNTR